MLYVGGSDAGTLPWRDRGQTFYLPDRGHEVLLEDVSEFMLKNA